MSISWASSSAAISPNGTVTRQDNDVAVTLTATATYNSKSAAAKTFTLRVIRRRTRDSSAIESLSLEESAVGDVNITRHDSGNIRDIDGQFVSFDILNADDATRRSYSYS